MVIIIKTKRRKKYRCNYKKLGCLFESFLGALFLDTNETKDETFLMGNGTHYCQLFIENVYNALVDWNEILENDDNYKNIFQVKNSKRNSNVHLNIKLFTKTKNYDILWVYIYVSEMIIVLVLIC